MSLPDRPRKVANCWQPGAPAPDRSHRALEWPIPTQAGHEQKLEAQRHADGRVNTRGFTAWYKYLSTTCVLSTRRTRHGVSNPQQDTQTSQNHHVCRMDFLPQGYSRQHVLPTCWVSLVESGGEEPSTRLLHLNLRRVPLPRRICMCGVQTFPELCP